MRYNDWGLVLTCLYEIRGHFLQTTPSNTSYHFAAYKQFICSFTKDLEKEITGWYHHVLFGRLGKPFPRKMVFISHTQKNEITSITSLCKQKWIFICVLVYIQICFSFEIHNFLHFLSFGSLKKLILWLFFLLELFL